VKVVLCDYGAGNTRSLELALARLGAEAVTSDRPPDVLDAELAVLPGVGSAQSAMEALRERGLDDALRARVNKSGPTLGICLGLQLALESSEEDGGVAGLGLLPGRARRLRESRVPRIGWAEVEPEGEAFYFAHSYAAETPTACAWSEGIVAEAGAGSFLGVQFHPEKSGAAGARFLARCLSRG
jgi:imidazole glycerol phosphate synthase glutamine amidotransferase subunit